MLLNNGEVTLLNQSGRLVTMTLSTHSVFTNNKCNELPNDKVKFNNISLYYIQVVKWSLLKLNTIELLLLMLRIIICFYLIIITALLV